MSTRKPPPPPPVKAASDKTPAKGASGAKAPASPPAPPAAKAATEASKSEGGRFIVGVDLGTTHCAMAGAPLSDGAKAPEVVPIPQVVQPGQVQAKPLLPSFLYLPSGHEFRDGAFALPWRDDLEYAVGAYARTHGAKVPDRVVASAKSWLCHDGVDRTAGLLPFRAPDEVPKISPIAASTRYLEHLAEAWNHAHPEAGALADQELVLTVPASFDAVARDLTVQAARAAGFNRPILLEEPQAALYAWLDDQGDAWRNSLSAGDVVLVCDVGGGTTDFSLIAIDETDGRLALRRIAVGDHILLGGDNMDLALAYTVRQALQKERDIKLDNWQLQALTQSCRVAKEALLQDPALASHPLVIPSRGSRLIGGTIRTELTRAVVDQLLVEGFFPRCGVTHRPRQGRRAGLAEIGLPYASDAAITRHLANFLSRHGDPNDEERSFVHPTAILFNGGVLKADVLRERVIEVINTWVANEEGVPVRTLESTSLDVSVARGAAYYGRVRRGEGIRIRGGIARSYYVGVEQAIPAVPGFEPPMMAVCLVPFGMEEGGTLDLEGHEFGLYVGEQSQFRFFASSVRKEDAAGAVLEDWDPEELEEMPPIEAALDSADGSVGQRIPVGLRCAVTEIGTLVLSCVEQGDTDRAWDLEFNVRLRKDEWSD